MVYDFLPTITTHHEFNMDDYAYVGFDMQFLDHYIEDAPRVRLRNQDWPVCSIRIVRKTISGLAILATCQQIASEARAILHPKL
jgi:hypothetical protein